MTGLKAEEPITVGPKRLQIVHSLKLAHYHYHRPGTPYRRVDLPGAELAIETLESGILDKTDDSFEIDSESERTLTEEPKEPKEPREPPTPKFDIHRSETPEGVTKRKVVPVVLPLGTIIDKGPKTKTGTKPRPKDHLEKGPEKKIEVIEKSIHNPGKGPKKWLKQLKSPTKSH